MRVPDGVSNASWNLGELTLIALSFVSPLSFKYSFIFFVLFSNLSNLGSGGACIWWTIVGCCISLLINPLGWNPKFWDDPRDIAFTEFDNGLLFGSVFGLVVLFFRGFGFSTWTWTLKSAHR